jgi:hypothetical protein
MPRFQGYSCARAFWDGVHCLEPCFFYEAGLDCIRCIVGGVQRGLTAESAVWGLWGPGGRAPGAGQVGGVF